MNGQASVVRSIQPQLRDALRSSQLLRVPVPVLSIPMGISSSWQNTWQWLIIYFRYSPPGWLLELILSWQYKQVKAFVLNTLGVDISQPLPGNVRLSAHCLLLFTVYH